MLKKIYSWLYRKSASVSSEAEYSSGPWQNAIRKEALNLCGDIGDGRAIEIGCGRGYFLTELASRNRSAEVWGIDFDRTELAAAKRSAEESGLTNMHFALQDATKLSLEGESFDIVICINVLLNLSSLDAVMVCLKNAKRICKKSGRIIFDYRNSLNPLITIKYKLSPYYDPTVEHLNLKAYTPLQIGQVLKDLEIDIVNTKYVGFSMPLLAPVIIIEARKR